MKNEPYKGDNMKLKTFLETPPWDWPEDVDKIILKVLRDNSVDESERLLAVELASDSTVINDDLAGELLAIVYENKNSDSLRGRAAISLGPALEYAFIDGFEDPDDVPISENRFREIQESLYKLYFDANTPEEVRRRLWWVYGQIGVGNSQIRPLGPQTPAGSGKTRTARCQIRTGSRKTTIGGSSA